MNVSPASPKLNSGTCPHGNPIGACPICAGLTGGGGGLANNKPRRAGEWTYDQCYSVWQQMLKAKANAEEQKIQQRLDYLKAQNKIKSFADKMLDKVSELNQNAINVQNPKVINHIQAVVFTTILTVANIVNLTVNIVRNTCDFIQQKFIDISDKLSAIYGELKLKIQKFLSEKHDFKQKLKSLFEIFIPMDIDNENKKIDEEKLLYKLKTTLSSIKEKFSKKQKEVNDDNTD